MASGGACFPANDLGLTVIASKTRKASHLNRGEIETLQRSLVEIELDVCKGVDSLKRDVAAVSRDCLSPFEQIPMTTGSRLYR